MSSINPDLNFCVADGRGNLSFSSPREMQSASRKIAGPTDLRIAKQVAAMSVRSCAGKYSLAASSKPRSSSGRVV